MISLPSMGRVASVARRVGNPRSGADVGIPTRTSPPDLGLASATLPMKGREKAPVKLTPTEVAFVRGLVIYEDPDILALNKPAGLSSQGGRGQVHTLDELLWAFAKPGKARPRLIHRLDRDTSGVILTARTKPGAGFLGKAMMGRRFAKTYRAIVTPGAPEPKGRRHRRPATP